MEETVFLVTIEIGETFDISAVGLARIALDVTKYLEARSDEGSKRIVFTGKEVGKALVRLHQSDGTITTIVVTVE